MCNFMQAVLPFISSVSSLYLPELELEVVEHLTSGLPRGLRPRVLSWSDPLIPCARGLAIGGAPFKSLNVLSKLTALKVCPRQCRHCRVKFKWDLLDF
jgi:hypothetical protein